MAVLYMPPIIRIDCNSSLMLFQLGEELSTDILNDVLLNSNKVDNVLTWL